MFYNNIKLKFPINQSIINKTHWPLRSENNKNTVERLFGVEWYLTTQALTLEMKSNQF